MAQHRALLDALQAEYGVLPHYIMAFWGIETNYGGFMGDFRCRCARWRRWPA